MSAIAPIRIRIVHRDTLAKAGLTASLAGTSDFHVIDDGDPFDHGEHVVVADLDSALDLLHRSAVRVPVIVVSGPDREREIKQALERRVHGYLVAGFSVGELADSVRVVRGGARFLCRRAASRLADSVNFAALTEREEAVLELVVQGLCNKSVARALGIACGTVKSHLKAAYGKLYVSNRTQAAVVSDRRGMLVRRSSDAATVFTAHA